VYQLNAISEGNLRLNIFRERN